MRKVRDRAFRCACAVCALAACAVMAGIVGTILVRGLPAFRWQFVTEPMRFVGAGGGILYNVVGTLILIASALAVSAPLAFGIALVHGVYLRCDAWRARLLLALHLLNGVPSLLFGLFGFIVFVKFLGWGKSWLIGGILLGMMILPTVTVALIERIRAVPKRLIDAAASLGLGTPQIVWSVLLPQSVGGWVTGSLIGLARAAGETAPILFTATVFAGATIPSGIRDSPVLSLPYHIFVLAQDSMDPEVRGRVWGTAVALLFLVGLLSLIALPFRLRMNEEARHG